MAALSLKTKMTVAMSVLTVVLLSVMAFSAQVFFVNQIKDLVSSQQFTMVSAIADQVDNQIRVSQNELVAAAALLENISLNDHVRIEKFFSERPDTVGTFDNGLFLFSARGDLISGNPLDPRMVGRNFSHRDYMKNTLATGKPQIAEPFASAQAHGHPIIMFTAPVFDSNGKITAVLGGSLDLLGDNFLARLGRVRLGADGYLYLYSNSRMLILHRNLSRILKRDVPPGKNVLFDRAIEGFEGSGETITSRGVPVLSSFKRLKTTGWILACNFPLTEAYAPAYRTQRFLLAALLVVLATSIVVVRISMKKLTAPLLSFTRQIRVISNEEAEQTRVRVETSDEIGVLGDAFNQLLDKLEKQKRELKQQLDFSQILIDIIPIPIFYKDNQGIYLGCNKAFEQFKGFPREAIVGKTVFDVAPPELAAVYHQADQELFANGGLQSYETSVLDCDGASRDVMFFKTTFPAADGSVGGILGATLDITESKRAEAALQEGKEFAECLVQNSTVPTFVLDCQHRVIIWNHACEGLTGIKASQVLGSCELWKVFYGLERPLLADLIISGELDRVGQYYPVHAESPLIPEAIQAEGWYQDPAGENHYVMLTAAPIRDGSGAIIGAIQTLEDLTERKQAQDAHEKTRRQLQLILDSAGEGINGVDLEGRMTFINPAAAKMVGWSQEELLGKNQHALMHHTRPDGSPYPEDSCPINDAIKRGETYQSKDDLFWRKDGTSFPVEYTCTPLRENGELVGAVVVYRDITERNTAEDQLIKLSQAVMQSPVSIVITDTSGTVEFVNPRFVKNSGYQEAEVIGQNPRLWKSGKTTPELYQNLWSTISAGRVWSGEIFNRKKNGETAWEHATISPITNSAGVICHYMAFLESMTERKRLEEQLRQAQKMEAIGQLAGGVAHDFNNILTVIQGFGQLVQFSLPPDDPGRGHMDQILDAADRATHLTRSLLAFSRKQVMLMVQTEINELTRKHTKFLVRIIGEDVTLKTQFTAEPLVVLGDAGQLEQVLMNLATNARDAMPGGGELTITTESVQLGKEFYQEHGYGAPGRYALITVSDTGCGMNAETRQKIFEPFFTTKEPGRGTGLGLSIVYGIIKQHGGYITIQSQPGLGTLFNIYLPLVAQQQQVVEKAPAFVPQGGTETILVVEDDPAVRRLIESVLKRYGYNAIIAASGEEAIALFETKWQDIHLALLDVIMPKMNGKEVYERLRERNPLLKVLFLSGYTSDIIQDKGILVEGIDIIKKPAKPIELARKIREMLDAR